MPWKTSDVDEHIKGLTDKQKEKWVSIANSVLSECESSGSKDCDAKAIKIANAKAKLTHDDSIITNIFSDKKILWKDIPTEETEDGLMIKGIPVFKTGTHKNNKYDEDFIDKKIISQFDPEEDVPLQADHSDSYNSTLGWVKKVYRKGKMLFADFLIVDDNAISRWKKGLMKKWSVGIKRDNGKLQEISAVAFPYVKEAAIHGDVTEVGMARDYEVEEVEVGKPLPNKEVIEIDAHDNDEHSETVNITKDEVDSLRSSEDVIEWSDKIEVSVASDGSKKGTSLSIGGKKIKDPNEISFYMFGDSISVRYSLKKTGDNGVTKTETYEYRNPSVYATQDLPDSAFALVRHPVKDKAKDRVLQYKDASGKIDPALIRNAIAGIDEVEDFSSESIDSAKKLLISALSMAGVETKGEEKMADKTMTQEESVLLKEAMEKEVKMAEDIKARDEQISKLSEEIAKSKEDVKKFKVEKEVAELKAAGKILPAQEAKITEFMLKLEDDARSEFVNVLKDGKTAVDLGETGAQESKPDATGMDFNKMSIEEIEREIEKYAKTEGIPSEDARDVLYEKYGSKTTE